MSNNFNQPVESEEQLDARLSSMKQLPRGSFQAKKGATDLKNCKVKITMLLDADIVEHYKERAAVKGSPPYQTQINNELRRVITNTEQSPEQVVTMAMLDNPEFLSALADKIKKAA